MSVIIDEYIENGLNIKLLLNNTCYEIYLITSASRYYCVNFCESRRCYCKDSDWVQGLWDGELIEYIKDKEFSENLFNFLKKNSKIIIYLDRRELFKWLDNNQYTFMKQYYSNHLNNIYEYFDNGYKKGFFTNKFYESLLKNFETNNKEILQLNIRGEYDNSTYTEKVFVNDMFFLEFDHSADYITYSLQQLSYLKIIKIHRLKQVLLDIDKKLFTEILNITELPYKTLIEYVNLLFKYEGFEEYSIDDFNISDISDKIDFLNNVKDIWNEMLMICDY